MAQNNCIVFYTLINNGVKVLSILDSLFSANGRWINQTVSLSQLAHLANKDDSASPARMTLYWLTIKDCAAYSTSTRLKRYV